MYYEKVPKNNGINRNNFYLHAAAMQDHLIRNTNIKFDKRVRGLRHRPKAFRNKKPKKREKWYEKDLI